MADTSIGQAVSEVRATPRKNPLLGLFADGLRGASEFAAKPFGYDNPPVRMALDAIDAPSIVEAINRASYGERMTSGSGQTTHLRPETLAAAMAMFPPARPAKLAGRAARAAEVVGPRSEALAVAQRNAALPYESGGLGLRADNTPMERARAMGFETAPSKETFHGSRSEIDGQIDPSRSDFGFHTGSVDQAEARLRAFAPPDQLFPDGANVLPLMRSKYANMLPVQDMGSFHADSLAPQLAKKKLIDKGSAKQMVDAIGDDWRKAAPYDDTLRRVVGDAGYDGLRYTNAQEGPGVSYAFSNPSVLRSRFAAFDPARAKEADIMGAADPKLLALIAAAAGGGVAASKGKP